MLTERLKGLEDSGLVEKAASGDAVVYRLTARGETPRPVLDALYAWVLDAAKAKRVAIGPGA